MKKLLALLFCMIAFSAQGQVRISNLTGVSPALGTDLVPISNTSRSTSSSYVLSVATIGAYVLASPSVTGQMRVAQAAAGTPMIAGATDTTTGLGVVNNWAGGGTPAFSAVVSGAEQLNIRTNDLSIPSGSKLAWSSSILGFAVDTNLSRVSAGVVGVGTGAAGSTAGTVQATNYKFPSNSNIAESSSTIYLQPAATGITQGVQAQSTITVGAGNDSTAILNFNGGTALSKVSAGVIGVGTGASASTAGALVANSLRASDFQVTGGATVWATTGLNLRNSTGTVLTYIYPGSFNGELGIGNNGLIANSTLYVDTNTPAIKTRSGAAYAWTNSTTDGSTTADTSISRSSAGVVAIGTGAAASTAGALVANTVTATKLVATNGAIVANNPAIDIRQVWNNGATAFTGINAVISAGASARANGSSFVKINDGSVNVFDLQTADAASNTQLILKTGATASQTLLLETRNSSTGVPTISGGSGIGVGVGSPGGVNNFYGDQRFDKTITAGGTTGAQTINKTAGSVNFAAAATSLVVTNNLVSTSSVILCTVGTNDSTMKSVACVAGAGSFTMNANAAATAETRVNFLVIN